MAEIETAVGMNWPQELSSAEEWLRFTLLTRPWLMFFSAMVRPADWWCLSRGRLMSLSIWVVMNFEA